MLLSVQDYVASAPRKFAKQLIQPKRRRQTFVSQILQFRVKFYLGTFASMPEQQPVVRELQIPWKIVNDVGNTHRTDLSNFVELLVTGTVKYGLIGIQPFGVWCNCAHKFVTEDVPVMYDTC